MNVKTIFLISLYFVLLLGIQYGCKRSTEKSSGETKKEEIMKEKAIIIAKDKAKELGYSLEDMTIKVTEKEGSFIVYFVPKAMVLGGDLWVEVNSETGKILDIKRGQ